MSEAEKLAKLERYRATPERELTIFEYKKWQDMNPDAQKQQLFQKEASWKNLKTWKTSYEDAIEMCGQGEQKAVQAALNLYKPRCDDRAAIFADFDKYFHLKMSLEMLYKRIFTYTNLDTMDFCADRLTRASMFGFTEKNVDAFIAKTKAEYKPYKDKKGRLVDQDKHVDRELSKLRKGYKERVVKTLKSAAMLFITARIIQIAKNNAIELDTVDFIKRVKVIEHFEGAIVSSKKQKGLFNLNDVLISIIKLTNENAPDVKYRLYDVLQKGLERNEYRHKPTDKFSKAFSTFVKKTDALEKMKVKIDEMKYGKK